MTKQKKIYLKLLEIGILALYSISFLWLTVLYLFGFLYQPITDTAFEKYLPFPVLVILTCLTGILLIIFVAKGASFLKLLLQAAGIIILAVPMFALILAELKIGIDDLDNKYIPIGITIMGTLITVGINDWKKIKAAANTVHK